MKRLILIFFLLGLSQISLACEVCGTAMTGSYNGIYPQFSNRLVGQRYGYSKFSHPNTLDNYNGTSRVLEDTYQVVEAWGRFYPTPRIQLLAFVPYQFNKREETERTTEISGVGDLTVSANYTIINTGDSLNRKFKHTWLAGGGITLPTGKYQARDENGTSLPAQFQIGTGAYAFRFMTNYTIRYKGWGLNTNLNYTVRGENERNYQFGNQSAIAVGAFYWFKWKETSILPNIGYSFEDFQADLEDGRTKESTGGTMQFLNIGMDVNMNRIFLRTFVQVPLSQELPEAQPTTGARINGSIAWVF